MRAISMSSVLCLFTSLLFATPIFAGSIQYQTTYSSSLLQPYPYLNGEHFVSFSPMGGKALNPVVGSIANVGPVTVSTPGGTDDPLFRDSLGGLRALDGSINVITITPGTPVSDVTMDLQGIYVGHSAVDFYFTLSNGNVIHELLNLITDTSPNVKNPVTSGNNYLRFFTVGGETISSITIGSLSTYLDDRSADTKFNALEYLGFSYAPAPIPEPSAVLLFATGLPVARLFRRRSASS